MANLTNVPPEVIELHNEMAYHLHCNMRGNELTELINLFSNNPLTPRDIVRIKSIYELLECLMKYDRIAYGNYKELTNKLKRVHPLMMRKVLEYTEKMNNVRGDKTTGENSNFTETDSHCYRKEPNTEPKDIDYHGNDPGVVETNEASNSPKTNTDWQFYLDWISDKLPSQDTTTVAVHLGIEFDKQMQIAADNKNVQHEQCFQVLWEWFRRTSKNGDEKIKALHDALNEAGRGDIAEQGVQRRSKYQLYEVDAPSLGTLITEIDILRVSKEIGAQYPSLARYFGIHEAEIHASRHDKDGIQEQAKDILKKCLNHMLFSTRRQLCDGLCYKKRKDIIDKLKDEWRNS
ncbi:uncharacterized protein LOC132565559 [Ylistrum balloti]|uniref:uncharacterized protein LOC132565559 n=1 Tax=Ylistrum balloti TaxID=509963 RepID=UPI002905E913|nr:uncharacterized protein LOC132565559 [Ylistrum balloti]